MNKASSSSSQQQLGSSSFLPVSPLPVFPLHKDGRRLLVFRHGERIDFTFNDSHATGRNWVNECFDGNGRFTRLSPPASLLCALSEVLHFHLYRKSTKCYQTYDRSNINMPRTLPKRRDGHESYAMDTPLTEMGYLQAKLSGRALRDAGVFPDSFYVSPALRCVQTAVGLLKEPGLFEWGAWFRPRFPSWMDLTEFKQLGYPINMDYMPEVSRLKLDVNEQLVDYYNRSNLVATKVLDKHKKAGECVLFVAHGASLDTVTRQLVGQSPRGSDSFFRCLRATPYLACAGASLRPESKNDWMLTQSPIAPLQHQANASYDVHALLR